MYEKLAEILELVKAVKALEDWVRAFAKAQTAAVESISSRLTTLETSTAAALGNLDARFQAESVPAVLDVQVQALSQRVERIEQVWDRAASGPPETVAAALDLQIMALGKRVDRVEEALAERQAEFEQLRRRAVMQALREKFIKSAKSWLILGEGASLAPGWEQWPIEPGNGPKG